MVEDRKAMAYACAREKAYGVWHHVLRALVALPAAVCLLSMASCSDDDGDYVPSVVKDMMLVSTGDDGYAKKAALDDGMVYDVSSQHIRVSDGKTVVRVMGQYVIDDGGMTIYGMRQVYCHQAYHADSIRVMIDGQIYTGAQYLPRDPVKLISIWKSGAFVNLYIGVMTSGDMDSQCVFAEDSAAHYSLVHRRHSTDDEAYTQKVYLSMPVPADVDTLTFSVKTYGGWVTKGFKWR